MPKSTAVFVRLPPKQLAFVDKDREYMPRATYIKLVLTMWEDIRKDAIKRRREDDPLFNIKLKDFPTEK
jgi:hypothetical protein